MVNKKILVISYYWFPYGGTGVYRISRFVKYLKRRGWEPIIFTARQSTGDRVESSTDPLFNKLKVYRSPLFEPAGVVQTGDGEGKKHAINPSVFYTDAKNWRHKFAVWMRLNLLVPDAKISWRFLGLSKAKEIIKREQPALILSTSPPPTVHLLAKKLAQWSGLPWLADFRDPWTNIYYYDDVKMNSVAQKINRSLERSVLREADRITLVNDGFFPEYDLKRKAVIINNGYDREDYTDVRRKSKNDMFRICYTGSLKMNQYPESLIEALRNLSIQSPGIAKNICLDFYGNVDSRFADGLQRDDLLCKTSFHGLVAHTEAVKQMLRADMQLLVIGKQPRSKVVLSTKVFEYMMSEKPILGIGPLDGAAARLLEETGTGFFFEHGDHNGVKKCIFNAYTAWEKGEKMIEPDLDEISKYDFERLTNQLEEIIVSLIQKRSR